MKVSQVSLEFHGNLLLRNDICEVNIKRIQYTGWRAMSR
jgi:hypothetical protein